ncbi:MAG: hypothetical protein AB2L24_29000 [Mangrovibacterium sp.]
MKKIDLIKIFILFFSIHYLCSCESAEMGEPTSPQVNGLLSFSVKIPGESAEYRATVSGPYQDGETIYIKVPTSEENPLDVTRLKPYASVENNCYVSPSLPGLVDFTEPFPVTVIDAKGTARTNYIVIEPTLQKTLFKKLAFMSANAISIKNAYISGLAAVGDHLIVHDGGNENTIKVYNRLTGQLIKEIVKPTTFTMQVKADGGGHFVVNRYNIYGAGFMVYFYEHIDSDPELILNYTAADGCPAELGRKMSVTGNLKEGKAYIYATAPTDMSYYYWEFNDGVLLSSIPTVVRYANAGSNWLYASVKRKSIDADSDHYITYCNYVSPDEDLLYGSRFEIYPIDLNIIQMNKNNHYYKIFDFEAFEVNGDEFLAMVHQGYWSWDATYLRVLEITDRNSFSLTPGGTDYDKFVLMESEPLGGTNYNRYGDVAVVVDGLDVYIYASVIAHDDLTKTGILAYMMRYTPQ